MRPVRLQQRPVLTSLLLLTLPCMNNDTFAAALDEINVQGRRVNLVGSATSASEGLISREELALRPLLRAGDVLESVPGLVATQHSGNGKANQFFLRGFNLDHGTDFATYVDGMPVNMRTHGHGQGYTDLNFLIPELIEQLSFRKGSFHRDVGDFSGAGSATIQSARHLDDTALSLSTGQYNFRRALLTGQAKAGAGEFIYGLEGQAYDGAWSDIQEDVGKTNLWLKYQRETDDRRFDIVVMGYDNRWNSADQIPERAVSNGVIDLYGSLDTTVGGTSSRYSISTNWEQRFDTGQLQASAYVIDYDLALWSNFSYFTQPQGDQFQQVDHRRIYGGQTEWKQSLQVAGLPLTSRVGAQWRYDAIDEVGLFSTAAKRRLGTIRLDQVDEWSLGTFWEGTVQWTPQLRTQLGLRYDYYDFDVQALDAADRTTLAANSGRRDAGLVTASFSTSYALNDAVELYAGVGQGFHSNDARGTTISRDPVTAQAVLPVDPLVDTLGTELGARVFLGERWNASVALWHLDIDSELLFVGDAGNTEDTGVGSQRTGVELTSYYRINDALSVDFEYAWTDARFDAADANGMDTIPGALENVLSGGMTLRLDNGLQAYLRLRHFGDYPLDTGVRAAASTLLNLRVSYALTPRLDLTADILNLLDSTDRDVEYFYESQLAGEAEPVGDKHFHVFEPRAVRLYARYQFQ